MLCLYNSCNKKEVAKRAVQIEKGRISEKEREKNVGKLTSKPVSFERKFTSCENINYKIISVENIELLAILLFLVQCLRCSNPLAKLFNHVSAGHHMKFIVAVSDTNVVAIWRQSKPKQDAT